MTPALRLAFASMVLLLFTFPATAQPPEQREQAEHGKPDGGEDTEERQSRENRTGDPPSNPRDNRTEHNPGPERLNLTGNSDNGRPRLNWTYHGHGHNKHYEIYRSQDNKEPQLLDTVPADQQSYTDTTTTVGHIYSYFVRNVHVNQAPGVDSNTAITDWMGCDWATVSISDPRVVLLHEQCIPILGPLLDNVHIPSPLNWR